jgi:elongation factor P
MEYVTPNDFYKGLVIEHEGNLWQVLEYQHTKIAQSKAFVLTKIKNLKTGQVLEKNLIVKKNLKELI